MVQTFAILLCWTATQPTAVWAQPAEVTRANIPIEELTIQIRPLTKSELLTVAEQWRERLKAKSAEVSAALVESSRLSDDPATDRRKSDAAEIADRVTELHAERTVLIDKLGAVLLELESKTDDADTETLATVTDYRLYMKSVSGVHIDVSDASSAWKAVTGWLRSEEGGLRWAWNIAMFLGILICTRLAAQLTKGVLRRGFKRVEWPELLEDFISKASYWLVMLGGFLLAMSALEVSMGPLLAMVGAAGFIIAFAMQDSLSNFASGLMILFFRPFDTGDVVEAGGVSGKIESMNIVATTILTFDNKRMIVPNNSIVGGVITNATGVAERRVDLEFGIGYSDDIDQAAAVLEGIVAEHPLVLEFPEPVIRVATLADSSVNFIVRPWVKTVDYWTVYWDITREVKRRFDSEGIGIPFPQQDVHLHLAQRAPTPNGSGEQPDRSE